MKYVQLNVRVTPETKDALQKLADKEFHTISSYLRKHLQELIDTKLPK